jgi:hypothetical protein
MGTTIRLALAVASLLGMAAFIPQNARATTFHTAAAAAPAIGTVSSVERTVCRFYPGDYPRRWAVYASAWPCYPSYSYYYYPRYPYYYYRRDPHYERGFIHRSF